MQIEQTAPLQHTQGRVEHDLLRVPAAMLEARPAQLQRLAARPPHCCTNLQHSADSCGPQPLGIARDSDGQLQVKAPRSKLQRKPSIAFPKHACLHTNTSI